MNQVKFSLAREIAMRSLIANYLMTEREEKMLELILRELYRDRLTHLIYMLFKGNSLGYRSPWDLKVDDSPIIIEKATRLDGLRSTSSMSSFYDDMITIAPEDPVERYVDVLEISELANVLRFFDNEANKSRIAKYIDKKDDIHIESYFLLFRILTAFENEYILPALEESEERNSSVIYMRNRIDDIDLITL